MSLRAGQGGGRLPPTTKLRGNSRRAPPAGSDSTISRKLEQACLRCLEKDPARRFATAGELARKLRRPSRARPIRWAAALVAVVILAAVTIAAEPWNWLTATPNRPGKNSVWPNAEFKELAFATINPTDFHQPLPDSSGYVVKSPAHLFCLQTHRPPSKHYVFRAAGEFLNQTGKAGLVLGIDSVGTTPPQYFCTAVYLVKDTPDPGIRVEAWQWMLEKNELQKMDGDAAR
jgi:hypothetical protein